MACETRFKMKWRSRCCSVFMLILLVAACNSKAPDNTVKPKRIKSLDIIYGDKVRSQKSGGFRVNNFERLKAFSASELNQPSTRYSLEDVTDEIKLLRQKKSYSQARNFDILLQLKKSRVANYRVLNDTRIIDRLVEKDGMYLLLDDEENHNAFWKTENKIELIRLDKNLNEISKYTAKSTQYPLRAVNLKRINDNLVARVEVIAFCAICTVQFDLSFDGSGNCISAVEVGRSNSNVDLTSDFIETTFITSISTKVN